MHNPNNAQKSVRQCSAGFQQSMADRISGTSFWLEVKSEG